MNQEISMISLIAHASLVVQIIMALLAVLSVISWGIIFTKWRELAKAKSAIFTFRKQYAASSGLNQLYNATIGQAEQKNLAKMFVNGINEYNKLKKSGVQNKEAIKINLERALAASVDEELINAESQLSVLASFGSISPYIGLLGTVWGIMHAFIGLGNTGQATLASVAPGIAEALIATAIGLFVAIPAYFFYNKFSADVNYLLNNMNKFGDEFLNEINCKLSATNSGNTE